MPGQHVQEGYVPFANNDIIARKGLLRQAPRGGRPLAVGCALMCLSHAGDTIHLLHVVPHAKSSYSGLFSHPDQHQQDLMVRRTRSKPNLCLYAIINIDVLSICHTTVQCKAEVGCS